MSNEEKFLKQLEVFLDTEFNDFSRKRILSYLEEYSKGVEPNIIYMEKVMRVPAPTAICTPTQLEQEGKDICNEFEVDYQLFRKSANRRALNQISAVRREFCKRITSKYLCTQKQLTDFFHVDHSTICFYMTGKKYFRKTA